MKEWSERPTITNEYDWVKLSQVKLLFNLAQFYIAKFRIMDKGFNLI